MATSLMDLYGQQSGIAPPQTSVPGTTPPSPFNFNQENYAGQNGITWNFDTPWAQQQNELYKANSVNGTSNNLLVSQHNLGDDYYKNIGFTGQAWNTPDLSQQVSGGNTTSTMTPEFQQWLKDKGYTYGSGMQGSLPFQAYFDQYGNPVQGSMRQGQSDTGAIEHFILNALAMYAGGQAFAGATGAEGVGAGLSEGGGAGLESYGAGGSAPGSVGFNPAVDSHLANLGGTQASVAAGIPLDPSAVWGAAGAGMSGAPISAGGSVGSVPTGVNLGDLGGAVSTGAGVSTIFNNAKDSQGANEQLGLPPVTDATKPAIPVNPGTGTNLSDLFNSGKLQDLISKGLGSALSGLTSPDGLKGLLGIYNANQQKDLWDKQFASIDQMFSPDSPYAKQMEETLARKDSAAGRNSQYGPRAQALAADLTGQKARMVNDLNNIISKQQDMMQSRASDVAAILQSTGLLNGLSSGVSSLFTELFDLLKGD